MAWPKKMTLRGLLSAWAALGLGVWLVLGTIAAQEEVECEREGGFICFGPGFAFVVTGLIVAVGCLLSGILIAIIWTVVEAWLESRRDRMS
jgi:hypothetical protein